MHGTMNINLTLCSVIFFSEQLRLLWDNAKKYCRAGQATDDNMAYAHCMLLPKATYTYSVYVTHCFCMATMVARPPLSVRLYVHCLSCLLSYKLCHCCYQQGRQKCVWSSIPSYGTYLWTLYLKLYKGSWDISMYEEFHMTEWCREVWNYTFYVLLAVHPCTVLLISQTMCTILLNIFIFLLYMFRAFTCPSSGENHYIYATLVFCHSVWLASGLHTRRQPKRVKKY